MLIFFLIGNQKTIINEKNKEEYMSFMMMNNKKNIKQRAKKREIRKLL